MTGKAVKNSNRPKPVRLFSLLLAAVMLVTAQGFTTYAGTVSRNETESQSITENGDSAHDVDGGEVSEKDDSIQADITQDAETDVMLESAAIPANPVHHCTGKDDGTDTTTWSYVYFGSYPQSEVVDSTTIAAIDSAIAAGNGTACADNTGTDVWVNGTKYRRITRDDTNDSDNFGESAYRYFKWESIKWKVLDTNDNGTLFVVADSALDCKDYHDDGGSITWENSTIRSWLNNSFYYAAFSGSEQNAIVAQNVVNEDNPYYGTEGGSDTIDKVYLLSIGEVTNAAYGFCNDDSTYSVSRRLQPSNYARARGTYISSSNANCWWWLRSSGNSRYDAAGVGHSGDILRNGFNVYYHNGGVVPALHINLSSDLWSVVDDGTSGNDGETVTPANPVHNCTGVDDGTDTTTWSHVYFGSYPQSEVTDTVAIAAVDSVIAAGNGTTGADNTGTDVWVNGTKYRRISKDDTNYDEYFDEKPTNNGYRYFKWEPIKWKVLNNNDNGTLLAMADSTLDCKDYHDDGGNITWENSTIRNWLNGSFYNTAFSSSEQDAIVAQNVVNENNPYYNTEGGKDTKDKVYLLSIGEVTNAAYGFCNDDSRYSASRWLQPSNYARARGTYTYSSSSTGNNDNCRWWLRSSGKGSNYAAYVSDDGSVIRYGIYVYGYSDGVVPALHINLSSGLWSVVNDDIGNCQTLTADNTKIAAAASYPYTGTEIRLNAEVTCNGTLLQNGTDYLVSYENNINAGTAYFTVIGRGNYTGSVRFPFIIQCREMTAANVKANITASHQYTGAKICPVPTVTCDGVTLRNGTDYTLSYDNNINPGTAYLTITGQGNYTGSVKISFTIQRKAMTDTNTKVNVAASYPYTGTAVTPVPTVTCDGVLLQNGTDYAVTYQNNTEPGKAVMTISGQGAYTGSLSVGYEITLKLGKSKIDSLEFSYSMGNLKKLNTKTYYALYMDFIPVANAASYEIEVTNYKGKKVKTVKVDCQNKEFINNTVNKLSGDVYGVRIRAYRGNIYGSWSDKSYVLKQPRAQARIYNGNLQIKWEKLKGVSGYEIYMSKKRNGKYQKVATAGKNSTMKTIKKYNKKKLGKGTYYYYVLAVKKVGKKTFKSKLNFTMSKKKN